MRSKFFTIAAIIISLLANTAFTTFAQKPEYTHATPMFQLTNVKAQPVKGGTIPIPMITWGGDVKAVYAQEYGLFKAEALDVSIFCENNFLKQCENVLAGKTPYLRGTMGMINSAAELFKRNNIELVVLYKYTWSTGGDAMVVRKGKTLKNIKVVALQQFGPHMDYAAKLFTDAGRNLKDIEFRYFQELTDEYEGAGTKILDPKSAFLADPSIDATMVIIPDALDLTSGGTVGKGGAGTVKDATILVTTKTAGAIISDVIAVRKDWFDANRDHAQKVVHVLMRADEEVRDLVKNKASQQAKYRQLLSKAAEPLWGTSAAGDQIEALLGDCTFQGYNDNYAYFTGTGTTRNFENLTTEIQTSFISIGLMTQRVALYQANWDYSQLAAGLKYAQAVSAPVVAAAPRFDQQKVAAAVESKIAAEASSWGSEGTLFEIEIQFDPNVDEFSEAKYGTKFQKALELVQSYPGALVTFEGHSNKYGKESIQSDMDRGAPQTQINQRIQVAKNLSLSRSNNGRDAFISFCKKHNFSIDPSTIVAVGLRISQQKFAPPISKDQWLENFRVVFRITQVEAEASEWEAPKSASKK